MLKEWTRVANRMSFKDVEEVLFLTVYDEEIIIIPDVMIPQIVDTLHESH